MSEAKTRRDWYDLMDEPERTSAINATRRRALDYPVPHIHSVHQAVSSGFNWSDSLLGVKYWYKIHTKYKTMFDGQESNKTHTSND